MAKATQRRHTILLVEDEQPLIELIKKKLELSGLSVVTARAVPQAIEYLEDLKQVDMVWLDHYLLGKKTGLDLLILMKKNPKWKLIPVFVVSNTGGQEKKYDYLRLGAVKYYVKADYRLDAIVSDILKQLHRAP